MTDAHVVCRGQVQAREGGPLGGARVEIFDAETESVLAEGFTAEDGRYKVHVALDDPQMEADRFRMRVVDARGEELIQRRRLQEGPGSTRRLDAEVPATRVEAFEPLAPPMSREEGSVLDPEAQRTIEAAVEGLAPAGTSGHNYYLKAARCPLPPIDAQEDLLDLAWGALDGDPRAARQLRTTLGFFAEREGGTAQDAKRQFSGVADEDDGLQFRQASFEKRLPRTQMFAAEIGAEPETVSTAMVRDVFPATARHLDGAPPAVGPVHPCPLQPERYLPVAAAAVWSARSVREAGYLLYGLEAGLCGLQDHNDLLRTAVEAHRTGDFRGLRSHLGRLGMECGPDDGPIPDFPEPDPKPGCPDRPFPDRDACEIERGLCVHELTRSLLRAWSRRGRYHIDTITPSTGCPGDELVIRGDGFGDNPERVCFPGRGGASHRVCVEADSWSDTEIRVEVPETAGSGEVTLSILEEVVMICNATLRVYRKGNAVDFSGGSGFVSSITVDGRRDALCVEPGRTVTIGWTASPDDATVDVRIEHEGTVLAERNDETGAGSFLFAVPDYDTPETLTITVAAHDPCGDHERTLTVDVDKVPTLAIEGLEVTQGVQTFWRSDGVADNSRPTIADKDTIVRVYVSADMGGFDNDEVEDITGTLSVGGTVLTPINGITPDDPTGGDPFITARPRSEIDRTETNHTLNFRIPAALASGTKTLRVRVQAPDRCGTTPRARRTLSWSWQNNEALRVRFVRIRDNRPAPDGTGTRPTAAQARFTIERAFDLLPSPPTDIGPAWQATWTTDRDFTTDDGLRGLLNDLDDEHNCNAWEWMWEWTGATECPDPDHAEWVGLTTPFNRGWATGGNTCMSAIHEISQGQGAILRIKTGHELGHNLGFCHVDRSCGGSSPAGSCYDHPDNGDLQDIPFDPFWNQVVGTGVGTVQDFMTYGCTRWPSGDSWGRLISSI